MSCSVPTVSLFLSLFIRKFEDELTSTCKFGVNFHLINFHARIYHQILQKIDINDYGVGGNDNKNENDHSLPRSLRMTIIEFSKIIKFVELDIIKYFDYNHESHPLIYKFFKLLRKEINREINKKTKNKKRNKNKKRKLIYDEPRNKRQRLSFGPYTRKHYLRDDEARDREYKNELKFKLIYNDSREINWIKLIDLKEIFHECLPQMPTPYITRILFDYKHRSIIALMDNIVFGGVCFRAFAERNFAEVVFLAISPNHQIKGFGTRLMNHLKETLKKMGIYHIVTFADNNAIDYFAKQGFKLIPLDDTEDKLLEKQQTTNQDYQIDKLYKCKNLDFDEIITQKYIKIYNGATLMHCRIIKDICYTNLNEHLIENRKKMVDKIGGISSSVICRKGILSPFNDNILSIPGVYESGLRSSTEIRSKLFSTSQSSQLVEVTAKISGILKQLNSHSKVGVFNKPVDPAQAGNYYHVIKKPMDLSKIQEKLNNYQYKSINQFIADFKLMIRNCKLFNPKENPYHTHAVEFDQYFQHLIKQY